MGGKTLLISCLWIQIITAKDDFTFSLNNDQNVQTAPFSTQLSYDKKESRLDQPNTLPISKEPCFKTNLVFMAKELSSQFQPSDLGKEYNFYLINQNKCIEMMNSEKKKTNGFLNSLPRINGVRNSQDTLSRTNFYLCNDRDVISQTPALNINNANRDAGIQNENMDKTTRSSLSNAANFKSTYPNNLNASPDASKYIKKSPLLSQTPVKYNCDSQTASKSVKTVSNNLGTLGRVSNSDGVNQPMTVEDVKKLISTNKVITTTSNMNTQQNKPGSDVNTHLNMFNTSSSIKDASNNKQIEFTNQYFKSQERSSFNKPAFMSNDPNKTGTSNTDFLTNKAFTLPNDNGKNSQINLKTGVSSSPYISRMSSLSPSLKAQSTSFSTPITPPGSYIPQSLLSVPRSYNALDGTLISNPFFPKSYNLMTSIQPSSLPAQYILKTTNEASVPKPAGSNLSSTVGNSFSSSQMTDIKPQVSNNDISDIPLISYNPVTKSLPSGSISCIKNEKTLLNRDPKTYSPKLVYSKEYDYVSNLNKFLSTPTVMTNLRISTDKINGLLNNNGNTKQLEVQNVFNKPVLKVPKVKVYESNDVKDKLLRNYIQNKSVQIKNGSKRFIYRPVSTNNLFPDSIVTSLADRELKNIFNTNTDFIFKYLSNQNNNKLRPKCNFKNINNVDSFNGIGENSLAEISNFQRTKNMINPPLSNTFKPPAVPVIKSRVNKIDTVPTSNLNSRPITINYINTSPTSRNSPDGKDDTVSFGTIASALTNAILTASNADVTSNSFPSKDKNSFNSFMKSDYENKNSAASKINDIKTSTANTNSYNYVKNNINSFPYNLQSGLLITNPVLTTQADCIKKNYKKTSTSSPRDSAYVYTSPVVNTSPKDKREPVYLENIPSSLTKASGSNPSFSRKISTEPSLGDINSEVQSSNPYSNFQFDNPNFPSVNPLENSYSNLNPYSCLKPTINFGYLATPLSLQSVTICNDNNIETTTSDASKLCCESSTTNFDDVLSNLDKSTQLFSYLDDQFSALSSIDNFSDYPLSFTPESYQDSLTKEFALPVEDFNSFSYPPSPVLSSLSISDAKGLDKLTDSMNLSETFNLGVNNKDNVTDNLIDDVCES